MKPVLSIGCLLGSMHVCIKNFAGGSSSWWVAENVIPILFHSLNHNRFITPCLCLKGDLQSSIQLFFLCQIARSATLCHEILKEVVSHFHLQKWLIRRYAVVFQGLIGHSLFKLHLHQSFHRFYCHPWQKEMAFGSMLPKSLTVKVTFLRFRKDFAWNFSMAVCRFAGDFCADAWVFLRRDIL